MSSRGVLHHVELWVRDLDAAEASLGWLLEALGHERERTWATGRSWRLGETYVVVESGPDVLDGPHQRTRAGLNHLAFWAGTAQQLDDLVTDALRHGWSLLYADRHPYAGGPQHRAAYLEDADGFEVELVADTADLPL
ncbi:glyoxalase [Geodermatophilus sp. TF02-6]|uniref:VOC family protein n=1 Tax=Geodermatophilus sp. TF02-6 TaxID=2250575 RepID=UPI000DEB6146|nr:VOC family protein [Geodermatophilus sp. TF02-6]RBY79533.1 glyoxalase [Geodermatophilus sp. TF02-6]